MRARRRSRPRTRPRSSSPSTADVDGASIGRVDLRGERELANGRWTAEVATDAAIGQHGLARVDGAVWTRAPGSPWRTAPTTSDRADVDLVTLDRVLRLDLRSAAEDLGLEYIEGARARHCRIAIDGPAFLAAFPQARWLAPDSGRARRGHALTPTSIAGAASSTSGSSATARSARCEAAVNGEALRSVATDCREPSERR